MFNNKTLCLSGDGKTGTTSLWKFLNTHPDIYSSDIKSIFKNNNKFLNEIYYNNMYKTLSWSKLKNESVLYDGTNTWWENSVKKTMFIDMIKKMNFKRICCIYVIRTPYVEFYESKIRLHYTIKKILNGNTPYINHDGTVNKNRCISLFETGLILRLEDITKYISKENIFIIDLSMIEKYQKNIYNFLEIDNNYTSKFGHYHVGISKDIEQTKEIAEFVYEHKQFFEDIEKKENIKIKEQYPNVFIK